MTGLDKPEQTRVNESGPGPDSGSQLTQSRSPSVLGYTYFVRDGEFIKIGSSMTPDARIKSLQTAIARELETLVVVPMEFADELQTHQRFAHLRERGEWFRSTPELLGFIAALKQQVERPTAAEKQPSSLIAPRLKIKIPQTLDQAAKLRTWLEGTLHTLSGKAHRHATNLIYQVKATEDEADLLREQKQAQIAWQAERLSRRLAEASR